MFRGICTISVTLFVLLGGCSVEKRSADPPDRPVSKAVEQTMALQSSDSLGDFAVYSLEMTDLRDRVTSTEGFIGSAGIVNIGNDSNIT